MSGQADYTRVSVEEHYITVGKRKDMGCFRQFIRDFPYSLFKQRRKDPDTKQYILQGKCEKYF